MYIWLQNLKHEQKRIRLWVPPNFSNFEKVPCETLIGKLCSTQFSKIYWTNTTKNQSKIPRPPIEQNFPKVLPLPEPFNIPSSIRSAQTYTPQIYLRCLGDLKIVSDVQLSVVSRRNSRVNRHYRDTFYRTRPRDSTLNWYAVGCVGGGKACSTTAARGMS